MKSISRANILVVEDSQSMASMYTAVLEPEGYAITHVESGEEALQVAQSQAFDVVLLDIQLPGMDGSEVLSELSQQNFSGAIVVITGHGSVDVAVDCMAKGVLDFIEKPINQHRLKITVQNAHRQMALQNQVTQLRQTFKNEGFESFVGASPVMQGVYSVIRNAAPSKAPVFVLGESGTGKELCAEAIHKQSDRANQPYVVLNCAAIPKELLESEIFGHVKGAFTGATDDRIGAAERADGGTLFLDEICELQIDLQSKLLRFLQTGVIQKVGANDNQHVDVRIVCATNRNPQAEVQAGTFREDLFYRLNVIPIQLPALRDRGSDILALAEHFLTTFAQEEHKQFVGIDPDVQAWLQSYPFPGNVRELQNLMRNIVVLHDAELVSLNMLPATQAVAVPAQNEPSAVSEVVRITPAQQSGSLAEIRPLWQYEKEIVEHAIAVCDGNIAKAATALGIAPSTIYRKRASWETMSLKNSS